MAVKRAVQAGGEVDEHAPDPGRATTSTEAA
jgi:hypothetical protein